jgi:hypothetical protein
MFPEIRIAKTFLKCYSTAQKLTRRISKWDASKKLLPNQENNYQSEETA